MSQAYSPKNPGETILLSWDFAPRLTPLSETIVTATWSVIAPEDASIDTSNICAGSPTHAGTIVSQTVHNGINGISYQYQIAITTNLGNIYIETPTQLVTSE